jgi:hypothetical protein
LRLSLSLNASARQRILSALKGLPTLTGSPIYVRALPQLTAHRGKLLSAQAKRGTPVHAASFIRRREIVLETELLSKPALRLIVVHEVFHFVWARLSNAVRASFTALLAEEFSGKARGELGESAAVKKESAGGFLTRDYVCESFCDTAAWLYAPRSKRNGTLGQRWRVRREAWFAETFAGSLRC